MDMIEPPWFDGASRRMIGSSDPGFVLIRDVHDVRRVAMSIPKSWPNPFKHRNFRAIELVLPLRYTGNRPHAGAMGRSGAIRPAIANTSAAVARNA
jgi:hypothetical protein